MFVSPSFKAPMLRERQDRRKRQRLSYPAVVRVNGHPVKGKDMSAEGLSVLLPAPTIGDIVEVTLARSADGADEIKAAARVVRVETSAEGYEIGLEFVE